MEATGLSVGKSVLSGALNYTKSAIAREVALQLGVQRDQDFIRDELEMMLSFLMAAHEERDNHKVVKTWVKQVRDVAYNVEDCLQDLAVRLGKPSRWCFLRTVVDRHHLATWMKELRAKVEDVSQRNVRYRLIKETIGPKSTISGIPSSIVGATVFGIEARRHNKPKVDLSQPITEENKDLRVIAVWGTSGVLHQSVIIKGVYDDLKIIEKFELYAWIRVMHPFNPLEFLQCIMSQFYSTTFQQARKTHIEVLKEMGMMKQADLVDAFCEHVNEKSYLIVLNDMSTIEQWNAIKEYFPDNKKGSRIIVSTEHSEVASLCAGQECIVAELNQSSVDQSIFAFYNKASQNNQTASMKMKPMSSSSETTVGTNNFVMPTDENVESQSVDDNDKIARENVSLLEESQLVGREEEKSQLINLISNQDDQRTMVISVCGMGGLGKTTIVKEVYRNQKLRDLFHKCACVTIKRPFAINEVLTSLVMQLDELGTAQITETKLLCELTEETRCLIVLDDLSSVEEWDKIIPSLSKMGKASRIVITTREESIAKHCLLENGVSIIHRLHFLNDTDALDLFTRKVFKGAKKLDQHRALIEEAKIIIKKCDGLPLAIVTIGGFLAKQPKTLMEWRKLSEHISAELEMNPELGKIRAILMKSYDGLPYHLKSCFLYLSIFPEDYNISRRRLVRRWIAEGYSSEVRGKSMGAIADGYFMELIERSMVLPSNESIGSRKGISSCKLHDLMREICISKATEENLVFRMEEGCSLNTQGIIRHLAISRNWEGDQSEFESTVDLSHIRSLTVFGNWKPFYVSDKMKMLRVLDLESTLGLVDHHLEPIWKLLHLKYLSLRECVSIVHLSESLGNLKQLETLDVTNTRIIKLPQAITKLRKLQYILAGVPSFSRPTHSCKESCLGTLMSTTISCLTCRKFSLVAITEVGVAIPRELRKLKALHTLGVVNIARGGKAILQEIKSLTRLRKLAVSISKKNCQEFCSTLACLSSLESLSVHSREKEVLYHCFDSLDKTPPGNLQSLKLHGILLELPKWVGGLHNLVKLTLEHTELGEQDGRVLGELPNLAILRLLCNSFLYCWGPRLSCCSKAFPSLTVLETGSSAGIKSVLFENGTAPKLELLIERGGISLSGLSCLPNLKEVKIKDSRVVGDVQEQLDSCPKKPILKLIDSAELRM